MVSVPSERPFLQKECKVAAIALPAVIAFAGTAFAPQIFNDGDTFWHIAAGEWMLDHRAVLHSDPFSFTFDGAPWDTHEWLAEIVMTFAYRGLGWGGLSILFGLAAGATALLLARQLSRWLEPIPLLFTLVLVAGCVGPSLLARPHLLALPLLVLWTIELLDARTGQRAPRWPFLFLMAVWANIHGSFFFGLALIAPFALEAVIEAVPNRRAALQSWTIFGLGALAASLLTPRGIDGLLFPLKLMGMSELRFIGEWKSMDFQTAQPLEIALVAVIYVFLSRGAKIPPLRLLLLLLMLHMSLQHMRHQMILALCGSLILAEPLGRALAGRQQTVAREFASAFSLAGASALALCLVLVAVRLNVTTVRSDARSAPMTALEHVPAELRRLPVFNDYAFGGYLIFSGVKPFIDSRAELYGDAFMRNYRMVTALDQKAWDATAGKYDIRWTILRPGNPAMALLDASPEWRRLYADSHAVVHVRNDLAIGQAANN